MQETEDYVNFMQKYHSERVARITRAAIYYNIDTLDQQSGSPVMYRSARGEAYVVGVHKGRTSHTNMGTRVVTEMIDTIKSWSLQMNTL